MSNLVTRLTAFGLWCALASSALAGDAAAPAPKAAPPAPAAKTPAPTAPAAPAPPAAGPPDAMEAMAKSIEIQKAAIRKQVGSAGKPSAAFFTVPWLTPEPVLPTVAAEPACDPLPEATVTPLIQEAARANDLKPELIRAVMRQESAFRACAISAKGAMGLMQLMPATAEQFAVKDIFDPKENISAGARYLKQLMTRFNGNLRQVLGAYNAGPGSVPESGEVPDIPETRAYVQSILDSLGPQDAAGPMQ